MNSVRNFAIVALGAWAITAQAADPAIKISDPWVRAAPDSAKVLAAYLTVENTGDTPDTLTAIESKSFAKIEVHRTQIKDGIARMAAVGPVEIPPHGSVALTPNGMHLMLMGADKTVRSAEKIDVTLVFKNAGAIAVSMPKKKDADDMGMSHEHGQHQP